MLGRGYSICFLLPSVSLRVPVSFIVQIKAQIGSSNEGMLDTIRLQGPTGLGWDANGWVAVREEYWLRYVKI